MSKFRTAFIGTAAAIALAAMPLTQASAHGWHRGPGVFFGLAAAGAAVGVAAATLLTAPVAIAAAPFQAPAYYPPPAPAYGYPPPAYAYPPGYYPQ